MIYCDGFLIRAIDKIQFIWIVTNKCSVFDSVLGKGIQFLFPGCYLMFQLLVRKKKITHGEFPRSKQILSLTKL